MRYIFKSPVSDSLSSLSTRINRSANNRMKFIVVFELQWGSNAWQQFSRAILLVRDPDRSILAEFNRQSGGHVGFASPERYKRTKGRCKQTTNIRIPISH